ncbi:MAG TPA: arginase family protein [Candidatus Acidoferrales bacterium]|nr:arginase family protein [Candidatus Acidoferrales bacterium]
MAVRIIRQPNKIALLGVPTSAAGLAAGPERAPAALRAAGLVEALRGVGYEVTDLGDDPPQLYQPDEDSPRARNLPRVVASLEALKPRVEAAVKSGALPLILSGDCSIALATVAGVRRYFRNVSLAYFDRDADLNTPATTSSGCVDGMVIAHMTGRGAAELVRFWGEPPLVREPDIVLFGVDRFDPAEEELLRRAPIRRYLATDIQRRGVRVAAQEALERIHGNTNEFVLHFDVDVISSEDFSATSFPGSGGLRWDEVRESLEVFATQKHLAAFEVTAYNPERDPDGSGAKRLIELLVAVLAARLRALPEVAQPPASVAPQPSASPAAPEAEPEPNAATNPPETNQEPAAAEGSNEQG